MKINLLAVARNYRMIAWPARAPQIQSKSCPSLYDSLSPLRTRLPYCPQLGSEVRPQVPLRPDGARQQFASATERELVEHPYP